MNITFVAIYNYLPVTFEASLGIRGVIVTWYCVGLELVSH